MQQRAKAAKEGQAEIARLRLLEQHRALEEVLQLPHPSSCFVSISSLNLRPFPSCLIPLLYTASIFQISAHFREYSNI